MQQDGKRAKALLGLLFVVVATAGAIRLADFWIATALLWFLPLGVFLGRRASADRPPHRVVPFILFSILGISIWFKMFASEAIIAFIGGYLLLRDDAFGVQERRRDRGK